MSKLLSKISTYNIDEALLIVTDSEDEECHE